MSPLLERSCTAPVRELEALAQGRPCLRSAIGAPERRPEVGQRPRAPGGRPRRLVVSGIDSLTPSERRIASMAAEEMTNRDIAQALFVTPKTVEMHLSNALRKLGVN